MSWRLAAKYPIFYRAKQQQRKERKKKHFEGIHEAVKNFEVQEASSTKFSSSCGFNFDHHVRPKNFFYSAQTKRSNKLECSSLTSLSSLVQYLRARGGPYPERCSWLSSDLTCK
jgi:hypothetical protein